MFVSKGLFDFRWSYLFVIYVLIYLTLVFLMRNYVLTDALFYSSLSDKISHERIIGIITLQQKYAWVSYLISPLLLLLKLSIISGIIFTGVLLFNKNLSFKTVFKIIMVAELIFIISTIFRLAYFMTYPPHTLQDAQTFSPLSILQFMNVKQLPVYFIYPLQQVNLFEFFYCILIIAGLHVYLNNSFLQSAKIFVCSYCPAMFLWFLCVVFLLLQFS